MTPSKDKPAFGAAPEGPAILAVIGRPEPIVPLPASLRIVRHPGDYNGYQRTICEIEERIDSEAVEIFMRGTYSTLDHLSVEDFRREIGLAWQCEIAVPGYLEAQRRSGLGLELRDEDRDAFKRALDV